MCSIPSAIHLQLQHWVPCPRLCSEEQTRDWKLYALFVSKRTNQRPRYCVKAADCIRMFTVSVYNSSRLLLLLGEAEKQQQFSSLCFTLELNHVFPILMHLNERLKCVIGGEWITSSIIRAIFIYPIIMNFVFDWCLWLRWNENWFVVEIPLVIYSRILIKRISI